MNKSLDLTYYLPKFWSKCAFWLFLLKVKVEGRENIKKEDSYVFLANHQGYYDIFLAYGYLGHNFKSDMPVSNPNTSTCQTAFPA